MELKGKISILINREYTDIEIEDDLANVTFLKVRLTPEQLSMVLSRLACVDCKLDVHGLEKVGKRHECKTFEFEITYSKSKQDLVLACNEALFLQGMHGWVSDNHFNSQNSFFKKDGRDWARCTIRRWV
jgi:hypothetical protein